MLYVLFNWIARLIPAMTALSVPCPWLLSTFRLMILAAGAKPRIVWLYWAPVELAPEQLLGLLRPLSPRLYSIASSQADTKLWL